MELGNHAASHELAVRMRWALARLGEIINEAREVGWAEGDVIPDVEASHELVERTDQVELTPFRRVARRLKLSATDVDLLWLLACIELDPTLSCAARHLIMPGMNELSAQMVERILAAEGGFADTLERLSDLALVETSLDRRAPLYCRPVRVHDGVLGWARGRLALDCTLRELATLLTPADIEREVAGLELKPVVELERAFATNEQLVIVATGMNESGRGATLRKAAAYRGRGILSVSSNQLPRDGAALVRILRTLARESRVHDAWPMLRDMDAIADQTSVVERELLSRVESPVLATASEGFAWPTRRTVIAVPIGMPDAQKRRAIWSRVLPSASPAVMEASALRYNLQPGAIVRVAATAAGLAGATSSIEPVHVRRALRDHLECRLAGLAKRIETRQSWDDLVLPVDQLDVLIELVARVRHRQRVLDDWGFAEKVGRGLGLAALLSGPPGTGKTMIAGLVANELGLDLYQVDLSRVVSKYIGETEKQLAALFDAAESGQAILLFDEADALFAKRTEVKSSNDRFANLEVNYLLQRIEMFSGIALLTTNHETAIDQAFLRRLAFRIRVPMPEEHERELLWRSMIPAKAGVADDVAYNELARMFVMSGGYIKNAVLRAAFMCAELSCPINNEQLWHAARREYEGMGMLAHVEC